MKAKIITLAFVGIIAVFFALIFLFKNNEPKIINNLRSGIDFESGSKKEKFSFAIIGDTQRFDQEDSKGGFQRAIKNITDKNPDFIVAMGDLISECDRKKSCRNDFNEWGKILGSLAPKTFAVMGNHDRSDDLADEIWMEFFDFPKNGPEGFKELVYSFDYGNSHFVFLNSEKPKEHIIDIGQRNWLIENLKNNKKDNIFVFFHEPAYPVSSKIGESLDVKKEDRDALWKIFEEYKVKAVFSGHEHIHSRKKVGNIYQFVFGNTDSFDHDLPAHGMAEYSYQGKSFGIVEVNKNEIIVNLFSIDGILIDFFKFPD